MKMVSLSELTPEELESIGRPYKQIGFTANNDINAFYIGSKSIDKERMKDASAQPKAKR